MTMRTNLLYERELLKSQQKSKLFRASLSDSSPPPELSHIRREFIIQRRLHLHTILSKGRPGSQLNLGLPELLADAFTYTTESSQGKDGYCLQARHL